MMRVACVAVLACAAPAAPAVAQTFPYEAAVTGDEVYVRSGPGKNYYPTAKLHDGDVVTVYRHDPGGWFAISPPEGSYSWISGEFVRPDGDGGATVTGDRVLVRVGAFQSDLRDVYQVMLSGGDRVEILGSKNFGTEQHPQLWYRIKPPAGEYRWIAGQFVQPADEAGASHEAPSAGPDFFAPTGRPESDRFSAGSGAPSSPADAGADRHERRPAAQPIDAESGRSYSRPIRPRRPVERRDAPATSASSSVQFDPSAMLVAEADRLLAQSTRQQVALWELEPVRQKYEEALSRATTARGRDLVQQRLERLQRYEAIRSSYDRFHGVLARSKSRDRRLEAVQQQLGSARRPSSSQYDGAGILQRARPDGTGTPRFMLTDTQGNLRYYVVPGADVQLNAYVGQPIAVIGHTAYRTDLAAHQITVREVVPIRTARSGGAAPSFGGQTSTLPPTLSPPR